uniref:dCTP pyrophosphatase 1 n=1 Tax=Suricata suricatta TaxID=37032 RepID=A0A673VPS2_SURSU
MFAAASTGGRSAERPPQDFLPPWLDRPREGEAGGREGACRAGLSCRPGVGGRMGANAVLRAAASMRNLLLNETGVGSTSPGASSWPWRGAWGSWQSSFKWKPDEELGPQAWPPRERAAPQEELSDVLIYLVALAALCHVDLPQAVLSKVDINWRHYPAHLSRGSALKYQTYPMGPPLKSPGP